MSSSAITTNFIIIIVTFIFAFFFVAAEFALVQTRSSQLEDAIQKGEGNKKKLQRALKMVNNLNEYLSTTQVGTSIAGIILGWIGESTIEYLLIEVLGVAHISAGGSSGLLLQMAVCCHAQAEPPYGNKTCRRVRTVGRHIG